MKPGSSWAELGFKYTRFVEDLWVFLEAIGIVELKLPKALRS